MTNYLKIEKIKIIIVQNIINLNVNFFVENIIMKKMQTVNAKKKIKKKKMPYHKLNVNPLLKKCIINSFLF